MEDIIRMGDVNGMSGWEYLGTVVQNGVEFIALQPLDGTSRVCFFFCDAGQYCRVADAETENVSVTIAPLAVRLTVAVSSDQERT